MGLPSLKPAVSDVNRPQDEEVVNPRSWRIKMPVCFLFIDHVATRVIYCDCLIITAFGGEQAMGSSV